MFSSFLSFNWLLVRAEVRQTTSTTGSPGRCVQSMHFQEGHLRSYYLIYAIHGFIM